MGNQFLAIVVMAAASLSLSAKFFDVFFNQIIKALNILNFLFPAIFKTPCVKQLTQLQKARKRKQSAK